MIKQNVKSSRLLTIGFNRLQTRLIILYVYRKDAEVTMDGQFLVRQIYDDEITYNLVSSAAQILGKYNCYSICFSLHKFYRLSLYG